MLGAQEASGAQSTVGPGPHSLPNHAGPHAPWPKLTRQALSRTMTGLTLVSLKPEFTGQIPEMERTFASLQIDQAVQDAKSCLGVR